MVQMRSEGTAAHSEKQSKAMWSPWMPPTLRTMRTMCVGGRACVFCAEKAGASFQVPWFHTASNSFLFSHMYINMDSTPLNSSRAISVERYRSSKTSLWIMVSPCDGNIVFQFGNRIVRFLGLCTARFGSRPRYQAGCFGT